MPLLIDGHNLIGAHVFDDIHLAQEDDEARLVAKLRVWQSRYRGKITVIFDRGITGGRSRELSSTGVEVIFARNPRLADDLIHLRIRRARSGRNSGLIVVTNDDAIRREAEAHRIETWRGHEFVERMTLLVPDEPGADADPNLRLSGQEVDEWLDLFGGDSA